MNKEVIVKIGLGLFIAWEFYYTYWFLKAHALI
jgi:hypothetical protein